MLIIGGGVCGLGVGWQLLRLGAEALLLERGRLRGGATWVSAGMLAPQMELSPEEEWVSELGRECMRRWGRFRDDLEADSGMSIDYRSDGTLFAALDRDAAARLRFLYAHQTETGLSVEWLRGAEARKLEPRLSRRVSAAILSPDDHQVDAAAAGDALVRAFRRRGGEIRENARALEVLAEGDRAVGVRLEGGAVARADAVVLAAGAWSGLAQGLPRSAVPPVRPVKGQILSFRQVGEPLIRRCVWSLSDGEFVYLAPKSDGRLLVGATVEELGFDTGRTAGAALELLRPACDTLPDLRELPLEKWSVGLRPASRDNAPILGGTPVEGLFMATGHYRNGILFAPVTSEDVAAAVWTGETSAAIAPYRIERFMDTHERED